MNLKVGEEKMTTNNNTKRKELKTKMAEALNYKINNLSSSMKEILLDDLVTAFESRFEVLSNAQSNMKCFVDLGVKVANETF
jgi:hypothetical protein